MAELRFAGILGTGHYAPEKILSNADLEKMVDTSDEWIRTRTGIATRHIASASETTSDLCVKAAEKALEAAGKTIDDIDFILVATALLTTSCLLQPAWFRTRWVQNTQEPWISLQAAPDIFMR